jgi:DNA-binding transcriptional ArsR family regulator
VSRQPAPDPARRHHLLASPLRQRILEALEEPRTARQVATLLGATPGNVHYHMRLLSEGGLIVPAGTRRVSGATEKYFRRADAAVPQAAAVDVLARVVAEVAATDADAAALALRLERVLEEWRRQARPPAAGAGLQVSLEVRVARRGER